MFSTRYFRIVKEFRIVNAFLPWNHFLPWNRFQGKRQGKTGSKANAGPVPRQKVVPYCSDELAAPSGESASLRMVVHGSNAHALGFLSHAHRPRPTSLDRSTNAPRRQRTKVSTSHAEHGILGAVDSADWRPRRAAQQLGSGARSASCVCHRRRCCHPYPQSQVLGQQWSICYGFFNGMWRE